MVDDSIKNRSEIVRDKLGRILPGQPPLNPLGRPAQKTLKEYAREWFLQMSNEDKTAYLAKLEAVRPGFAWTMSEGNPTEDRNVRITVPTPILGGASQAVATELLDTEKQPPNDGLDASSAQNTHFAHIDGSAPHTTSCTPPDAHHEMPTDDVKS